MSANSVSNLIEALGGASFIAGKFDLPTTTVASWKARGSIPVERWPGIVSLADEKQILECNYEALVSMHSSEAAAIAS